MKSAISLQTPRSYFIKSTSLGTLDKIKTTLEGIKVFGAAVSKSPEYHAAHIRKVIQEALPALQAITTFGKDHLQLESIVINVNGGRMPFNKKHFF